MNCDYRCSCNCCLEIVISILVAAAVGVLFAYGFISGIITALWIVFGLAVLALILFVAGLYTSALSCRHTPLAECICCKGKCLLAGIIGTIVLALATLSITLVQGSIWVIVLISIAAFFAAFMLAELVVLLVCIINKICCRT